MSISLRLVACLLPLLIAGCSSPRPLFTHDQVQRIQPGFTEEHVAKIMPPPTLKTNVLDHIDAWVWQNPPHVEPLAARALFTNQAVLAVDEFSASQITNLGEQRRIDLALGDESPLVRRLYVDSHPNLDPMYRDEVLAGTLSTAAAESYRLSQIEREKTEAEDTRQLAAARAAEAQARMDYASNHPEVSQVVRAAILERRLVVGMTRDQVQLALGAPKSAHSTTTALGRSEIWTFYGYDTVAMFQDGILTSFSD